VKDLNSVKAYRREIMDMVPMRPDWHRFMVVIAAAQGSAWPSGLSRCIRDARAAPSSGSGAFPSGCST